MRHRICTSTRVLCIVLIKRSRRWDECCNIFPPGKGTAYFVPLSPMCPGSNEMRTYSESAFPYLGTDERKIEVLGKSTCANDGEITRLSHLQKGKQNHQFIRPSKYEFYLLLCISVHIHSRTYNLAIGIEFSRYVACNRVGTLGPHQMYKAVNPVPIVPMYLLFVRSKFHVRLAAVVVGPTTYHRAKGTDKTQRNQPIKFVDSC